MSACTHTCAARRIVPPARHPTHPPPPSYCPRPLVPPPPPQVFGKRYYEQMPSMGLKSTDAAYVLAFSVIMLNTDLHNTQVGRAGCLAGALVCCVQGVLWKWGLHRTAEGRRRACTHPPSTAAPHTCSTSPANKTTEQEEDEPGGLCAHQPQHERGGAHAARAARGHLCLHRRRRAQDLRGCGAAPGAAHVPRGVLRDTCREWRLPRKAPAASPPPLTTSRPPPTAGLSHPPPPCARRERGGRAAIRVLVPAGCGRAAAARPHAAGRTQ